MKTKQLPHLWIRKDGIDSISKLSTGSIALRIVDDNVRQTLIIKKDALKNLIKELVSEL